MNDRKCSNCMYWEQIYNCTGSFAHVSGLCYWLSNTSVPMWLEMPNAVLNAQTMGGAGSNCCAYKKKGDNK